MWVGGQLEEQPNAHNLIISQKFKHKISTCYWAKTKSLLNNPLQYTAQNYTTQNIVDADLMFCIPNFSIAMRTQTHTRVFYSFCIQNSTSQSNPLSCIAFSMVSIYCFCGRPVFYLLRLPFPYFKW